MKGSSPEKRGLAKYQPCKGYSREKLKRHQQPARKSSEMEATALQGIIQQREEGGCQGQYPREAINQSIKTQNQLCQKVTRDQAAHDHREASFMKVTALQIVVQQSKAAVKGSYVEARWLEVGEGVGWVGLPSPSPPPTPPTLPPPPPQSSYKSHSRQKGM